MPPSTLLALVKRSADYLAGKGIGNARREAEWIFAESLALPRIELYTKFDMPLSDDEVARLRDLVTRRGRREPLAYVLGNHDFRGLRLRVGPGVLVPRPETEELVDRVLAELPPAARVADIGTGSGAIALAIRHARPDSTVIGCDVDPAALVFARANAEALGLAVEWREGDLASPLEGTFDAVLANLPYIAESERGECDPELAFEPQHALFAADEGMAVMERLIADVPRLLKPGGILWLEHGWRQGPRVTACAAAQGMTSAILPDSAGRERFARITRG